MTELPVPSDVEELRRLIAIDAQRYARRALRMHDEVQRGVPDESYDRMELMKGSARASHYCWALVALLGHAMEEDRILAPARGPGLAEALAHIAQQVIATGEPCDHRLIAVEGLDDTH